MVEIQQNPEIETTFIIPHLLYPGLERCIRTLWKYTPHKFRVILVDQGRRDWTHLQREGLVDVIIKTGRNLGFAKSCNTALRLVDTKYVCFLNDDVEFIDRNWYQKCISLIENDESSCGINPHSFINPNGHGEPVSQYKDKDTLMDEYTEEELQEMRNVFSPGAAPGNESMYLAGCTYATIVKTAALEDVARKIGSPYRLAMFDESFGSGGGEDYSFVRTMGIHGYKILGTHRAFVKHMWLSTRRMLAAYGYGEDAYATTKKGYERFRELWGVTHGTGPNDSLDGADPYGRSGPKEPLNGQPWSTVVPL